LDFILIHAFTISKDNQREKIHIQRMDYGIQLYNELSYPDIIVAGKLDKNDREHFEEKGIPLSKIMKDYLIQKGVPEEKIHEEPEGENSYDCTMNVFKSIIPKNGWKSGVIVSSSEHLPRITIQTMKVMTLLGMDGEDMKLFYSGPSIENSGAAEREIERFKRHEAEGIIYTLGRED